MTCKSLTDIEILNSFQSDDNSIRLTNPFPVNQPVSQTSGSRSVDDVRQHQNYHVNIFEENVVYNIINRSTEGQFLLSSGILKGNDRSMLSRIVLKGILDCNPSRLLTSEEFVQLARGIVNLFPSEPHQIYYNLHSGRKNRATGTLAESYSSLRRVYRNKGLISLMRNKSKAASTSLQPASTSAATQKDDMFSPEIIQVQLQWLRNNVSPWEIVVHHWESTANFRLKEIKQHGTVKDYLDKYSVLKEPEGYQLLISDFNQMFSGKENILYCRLSQYRGKLLDHARERLKSASVRDKLDKAYLVETLACVKDVDSENIGALLVISHILRNYPAQAKSGWKASRSEVRDGFITHIVNSSHLLPTVAERKEKLSRLQRKFQPLVIGVGPSLFNVSSAYVVVDDVFYKFNNLLSAVDTCFKIIHALGAEYPQESRDLWLFIQLCFYDVKTDCDRVIINQAIRHLLANLGISIDI